MNITIRQATDSDLARIRELYARWVESGDTLGLVNPEPGHFVAQLGPLFVVAECEGEVIGFAIGTEHTSNGLAVIPKGERYVEIDDVYVIPEHQRLGVGARLIEETERRANSAGIHRFLVYSASKDMAGIMKFYGTHGYKRWYVQMYK